MNENNIAYLPGYTPDTPPDGAVPVPDVVQFTGTITPTPTPSQPAVASGARNAPWPLIDKYPTIIGSALSLSYLSSVYRLALTGWRRDYVDALSELLERDPHLYAVLMQRVLTACGARIVLSPRDTKSKRCVKMAADVQGMVDSMEGFRQALATLVFSGLFYGIGSAEVQWEPIARRTRTGAVAGFVPKKLHFIHSRRLNFPDACSWDLCIQDQGMVTVKDRYQAGSTNSMFGMRITDYPGTFVTFAPQLHADYPTREGVGRIVAFWSALKTMGARGAAQYVERYAKPWALATYATTSTGVPRAAESSAQNNDVGAANAALMALGTGSLSGAVVPDSVKIDLRQITGSRSNLGHKDWIDICNSEMSKGVLGQSDTTGGGEGGSRAKSSVAKTGSDQIARLDVMLISDCLQTCLIDWIVKYNWPAEYDKRPIITLAVDPEPDPYGVVKLATMFAGAGAPVDVDDIARTIGIKLVTKGDKDARQMAPLKPVDIWTLNPDRYEQPVVVPPPEADPSTSSEDGEGGGDGSSDNEGDPKKVPPDGGGPKNPNTNPDAVDQGKRALTDRDEDDFEDDEDDEDDDE
jgi:phage gp29-like protein